MTIDNVVYGVDCDQHTCVRPDFIDLHDSPCGFGDTDEEALADLIRQEAEENDGSGGWPVGFVPINQEIGKPGPGTKREV